MKASLFAVLLLLSGCADEASSTTPPGPEFDTIPEEAQRGGDPAAGRDYLINGGYITCGIPKSVFDRVFGPQSPGMLADSS